MVWSGWHCWVPCGVLARTEKCGKCSGARCPSCFHTGKRLFEIGQRVVWENQDHSLEPESLKARNEKYLGGVYTVNALMNCPERDSPAGHTDHQFADLYYVGIDDCRYEGWSTGTYNTSLVFDANLRPATPAEIASADATAASEQAGAS